MQSSAQSQDGKDDEGVPGSPVTKTNPSVPQQEEHTDTAEGKVIADYDPHVDYERSESRNEPDAQGEKEENSDAEYMKMEIPHAGTFCLRMTYCNVLQRILHVH